jgi:hypothetical protein
MTSSTRPGLRRLLAAAAAAAVTLAIAVSGASAAPQDSAYEGLVNHIHLVNIVGPPTQAALEEIDLEALLGGDSATQALGSIEVQFPTP